MKKYTPLFILLSTLGLLSQSCKASDDALQDYANAISAERLRNSTVSFLKLSDSPTPSAFLTASSAQQIILEKFNKGNDDETEEAAKLALLLITQGPVKKAENERQCHLQTCKEGRELMYAGGSLITFGLGLHHVPLSPTSYYSGIKYDTTLVSSGLGFLMFTGGFIKYHVGKWRLNKIQKKQ